MKSKLLALGYKTVHLKIFYCFHASSFALKVGPLLVVYLWFPLSTTCLFASVYTFFLDYDTCLSVCLSVSIHSPIHPPTLTPPLNCSGIHRLCKTFFVSALDWYLDYLCIYYITVSMFCLHDFVTYTLYPLFEGKLCVLFIILFQVLRIVPDTKVGSQMVS